ncbi:DegV family protein [Tannockella kyphosi]|uniref:DegV family protein n=1 Tax=Tannockella kyphosi TaxID=2899121 RepID=UPI0020134C4E|nr:DegV family protein [Tannockella kyphosi]
MTKVAIVTDSNGGINQAEGEQLGIYIVPMPFTINKETLFEDINLTQEEFYQHLENDAEVFTSQPTPGDVIKLWENILKEYDEIVHIPMSSGLSGSCQTAIMLASELHSDKVQVIDAKRVSITQRGIVEDAINLVNQGKNALEIKNILEDENHKGTIYLAVATLDYLKKGGRITPAAATLGAMLKIKPILTIQGEKLDAFSKTRTMSKAYKIMAQAIQEDINKYFKNEKYSIAIAHSNDLEGALELKSYCEIVFPGIIINIDKLSLSVSCHTGPGAIGIGIFNKI